MAKPLLPGMLLLSALLLAPPAQAQDTVMVTPVASGAGPWKFTVRPYLFLAGISGSVTSGSNTIAINSTFSELIDNLKPSLFSSLTFEKGQWGAYGDFQYISLSGEGTGAIPSTVGLRNIIAELDGTFRPKGTSGLRFVAGVRGYQVDETVTIGALPPAKATTLVFDPIIGAMGEWQLGDRWEFEFRGDIGGFGASSEFTSQLSLMVLYDVSKVVSIPLGYRTLSYRIKDDVQMDTEMGGLVVGVDIRP